MRALFLILCVQFSFGQCMTDIARCAHYNQMEVFNHKTEKYDKYPGPEDVYTEVIVDPEVHQITVTDTVTQYFKTYTILDCQVGSTSIVYLCWDPRRKQNCEFTFSTDKSLTVQWANGMYPIIYRVKTK